MCAKLQFGSGCDGGFSLIKILIEFENFKNSEFNQLCGYSFLNVHD